MTKLAELKTKVVHVQNPRFLVQSFVLYVRI